MKLRKKHQTGVSSLTEKRDWEYLSFTYSQLYKTSENNFFENEIRLPMIGSVKADLEKETLKKITGIRYFSVVVTSSGYFVAIDFLSDDLKRERTLNEWKFNNQHKWNYIYLTNHQNTWWNYFFKFNENSFWRTSIGALLMMIIALFIVIEIRIRLFPFKPK